MDFMLVWVYRMFSFWPLPVRGVPDLSLLRGAKLMVLNYELI